MSTVLDLPVATSLFWCCPVRLTRWIDWYLTPTETLNKQLSQVVEKDREIWSAKLKERATMERERRRLLEDIVNSMQQNSSDESVHMRRAEIAKLDRKKKLVEAEITHLGAVLKRAEDHLETSQRDKLNADYRFLGDGSVTTMTPPDEEKSIDDEIQQMLHERRAKEEDKKRREMLQETARLQQLVARRQALMSMEQGEAVQQEEEEEGEEEDEEKMSVMSLRQD